MPVADNNLLEVVSEALQLPAATPRLVAEEVETDEDRIKKQLDELVSEGRLQKGVVGDADLEVYWPAGDSDQ